MNQQNQAAPKTFTTIDGNSLMAQEYEPLQFAIEKILPHGIFIFAGSPKVGKSWLLSLSRDQPSRPNEHPLVCGINLVVK